MKVLSLHKSDQRGLPRPPVESVQLIIDKGVEGDRKAGKRRDRQILLVGRPTYAYLLEHGIELPAGGLGENLLVDFDPMQLEPGTHLSVGEAVLEISLRCSPCAHLYEVWPGIRGLISGRRGMLARVLKGGSVRKGDLLEVVFAQDMGVTHTP